MTKDKYCLDDNLSVMNKKFVTPYLVVTVCNETCDMSVCNVEKEDFYIAAEKLIFGAKLSVCSDVPLHEDYTVIDVNEEYVKLNRNGVELVIKKDKNPGKGSSSGGRNPGGVFCGTSVSFEYRTPLSREEIDKIPEMAIDAALCPREDVLECSNRHIRVLNFVERAVKEGNVGLYVAWALLEASANWEYCDINRPELFRKIFTEGLREGSLAPDKDNYAWRWMEIAIVNNDPGEFADDMDLYYDALASAAENGIRLACDIMDMIWEPENCQEED